MLALIFLCSACGTAIRPSTPRPDAAAVATVEKPTPDASPFSLFHITPVLIIGDSIMVGARDIGGLQGLLEQSGWNPEIMAQVGAGLPWAIEHIEVRLVVPRIVVVEMGTNPSPLLGNFENEVRQLLDDLSIRGARHIIWIPPQGRDPTRYQEKDAVIAATAGRITVSGWAKLLETNPQWFGDEVHLTEQGYRQLANYVYQELQPLHG
jgi:lysophospholipase L1-like esterase